MVAAAFEFTDRATPLVQIGRGAKPSRRAGGARRMGDRPVGGRRMGTGDLDRPRLRDP